MKNLLLTSVTFVLILLGSELNAQNRKVVAVKKHNNKTVAVVHKKQPVRRHAKRTRVVHYHYKHLPKRGAIVSTVHANAIIINHRGLGYRYHSGIWYKPNANQWIIAKAPLSLRVKILPADHRKIVIGSRTYYYYFGTYYILNNSEYEVIEAPIGAEVDSLPDGYNTLTVNGEDYYELDGIYYASNLKTSGEEVLVVIKNPNL